MRKKTSFIQLIQFWGIILFIALGVVIVALDVFEAYQDFNFRADEMRTDYIRRQKQIIKHEVESVVNIINHEKAQSEVQTKIKIKTRLYEAVCIANNIYQQNKAVKRKHEIQKMVIDALSPIRFEQGLGCYFISRLDGESILFPTDPEMEGVNLLDVQDTHGKYITKDWIEIARKSGEGFYEYHGSKPDADGNNFKKISFIKLLEPYDWFVGTGLYLDDVENKIKADMLSRISRIRYGKEGYIFINRLNGDALLSNGELFTGTKKLWEVFNKNPEKVKDIFEKEYHAASKPEGDYIYYSWKKLTNSNEESPKASFVYGIPDLQWLVGAGVYLDDVETEIAVMQSELNNRIKRKMFYSVLIIVGVVALFLILFNRLNRRLKHDFSLFISFFNRAVYSDKEIDRGAIKFIELDQMAENANKMLQDKIIAQKDLRESEENFRTILNSIGDAVITTGLDGRVSGMNPIAEKLTGWKFGEAAGKPLTEIFNIINEETREAAENPAKTVLAAGKIVGLVNHTVLISKDGIEYHIADSAAPIKDTAGNITGVVLVFRDVTERLKTEAELLKVKKLESVGILAGGIAHDFNNILMGLFGNIELAKMKLPQHHEAYTHIAATQIEFY